MVVLQCIILFYGTEWTVLYRIVTFADCVGRTRVCARVLRVFSAAVRSVHSFLDAKT